MPDRILVALDGSELSKKALEFAIELVDKPGSVSNKVNHTASCTCITVH